MPILTVCDQTTLCMRELLPCKYYHVVFTLPHLLNPLVMANRRELFGLLFEADAYTLQVFPGDIKSVGLFLGFSVTPLNVIASAFLSLGR